MNERTIFQLARWRKMTVQQIFVQRYMFAYRSFSQTIVDFDIKMFQKNGKIPDYVQRYIRRLYQDHIVAGGAL